MRVFVYKYFIYLIIKIWNLLFIKRYVFLKDSKDHFDQGCIIPTWHQNILLYFGAKFHKGGGLASRSRDGDYMLKIAESNQWRVFRGSSSKGGKEAMDEVIDHFKNVEPDMTFLITPDRPRGPRHKCKRGIFFIARETQKPIIPMIPIVKKNFYVNSWDQHKLAVPFQVCHYVFGEPIYVPKDEADLGFKNIGIYLIVVWRSWKMETRR